MNKEIENIKEQLEQVINKNLPEKKEVYHINSEHCVNPAGSNNYDHTEECTRITNENAGFNQALSQINTSLIADEVLKVVVEKIRQSQGYVASIPEIDHSLGELLDSDIQFNQHPAGSVIFKNEIINLLTNSSTLEGERSEHLSPNKENEKITQEECESKFHKCQPSVDNPCMCRCHY